MKYPRNSKCFCGSTIKYKKCHGVSVKSGQRELPEIESFSKHFRDLKRKSRFKHCIHPDQSNCSRKIIHAHSIQNNRILTQIAKDGIVVTAAADVTDDGIQIGMQKFGRKKASAFTGFCGDHDKLVFQAIEDREFIGIQKQHFLFAYRAFAREYCVRQSANAMTETTFAFFQTTEFSANSRYELEASRAAARDLEEYKKIFDEALLSDNWDVISTETYEYATYSPLAVSSCFNLEYDLRGQQVNNVMSLSKERLKPVFFTLFPDKDKTRVLFSYFTADAGTLQEFKEQVKALDGPAQQILWTNIAAFYCENTILSPIYWDSLTSEQRDRYEAIFHITLLSMYADGERLPDPKQDLQTDQLGFNLFSQAPPV